MTPLTGVSGAGVGFALGTSAWLAKTSYEKFSTPKEDKNVVNE